MDTVEHREMVDKELSRMVEKRSRGGEADPDEQEELWKASVTAYTAKRNEEMRAEWHLHHTAQAERLRRTLEVLVSHHEQQAAKLMVQPKGVA